MSNIEQLVPDLPKHIVAMQRLAGNAYGVCWVAGHDEEVWEYVAGRAENCTPLLARAICKYAGHGF